MGRLKRIGRVILSVLEKASKRIQGRDLKYRGNNKPKAKGDERGRRKIVIKLPYRKSFLFYFDITPLLPLDRKEMEEIVVGKKGSFEVCLSC